MVPNARTSVDRVAVMPTVQSSTHIHAYTHAQKNKSTVKSEVRGYIHNNKNKTKTCTRTVRNGSIQNWTRATPKLWNEVTLSSANTKFIVTGLLLVPPLRPQGSQVIMYVHTQTHAHAHMNTQRCMHPHAYMKKYPLVSPRRPPGREGGTARWDTPLSCGGSGWRGRHRSSAGLSPSLAAWARNVPLCVCGS